MKKLVVKGASGSTQLLVGESIDNLGRYVDPDRTVILTDTIVEDLYRKRFPTCPVVSIGQGETIKTLETVTTIFNRLMDVEVDRSSFILGVGGGIVCDIAGFTASTYMRGVRFGFVPTTLLSQVDASVGGKNGVNLGGYKNMVGVFNQPEFVVCDMELLKTLPVREVLCGFAEIIKHGAIADSSMLDFLERHRDAALNLDTAIVSHLVYRSVEIKAGVVTRDEREHGERRKLNFGHTFGHALEKATGMPHGEAVGIGMVLAARLSVAKGLLPLVEAARLEKIIHDYGLPVRSPVDVISLLAAMRKDKKRQGSRIHFVFLDACGSACVEDIDFGLLTELGRAAQIF
ncbi:MAG: 3-dehydroquinate synthase [Desulfosarcina sp.]